MMLGKKLVFAGLMLVAVRGFAQTTGVSHPEDMGATQNDSPAAQTTAAPAAVAPDASAPSAAPAAPVAAPLATTPPADATAPAATTPPDATATAPVIPAATIAPETVQKAATYPRPGSEAAIDNFARTDAETIDMTMPAAGDAAAVDVLLHDFEFEDSPVATSKLHLKQLAPGVYEITSLAYHVGDWEFRIHDKGSFYGLGEHFNTLDHAHEIVRNMSQDNAGPKGSSTYKPVPFFMSLTGYGVWVDTTAEATFDMNVSDRDEVMVRWPAERLRILVFAGPGFPAILDHFTAAAGRQQLPPYWALAPWVSRDYHQSDAQVREDVDRTRALGLPASVILIDSPWATNYNTYTFNPKQFSEPEAMIAHIHGEGFKLVLWHTPWINSKTALPYEVGFADKIDQTAPADNYAEAATKGYFVKMSDGSPYVGRWWKGMGSLIDFTNPDAKAWWQDQLRQVIRMGADGFKDDDAEGAFLGDVRFFDKTDQRLMRDKYAVLYNNAVEEVIQKDLKGNGVLFQRSATVGNMNLPLLWGGDSEASFSPENGLPTAVTAGLGAGLSGMALWTSDLGGYLKHGHAPDEAQVFMRWTEYAAWSPAMEIISTSNMGAWDYGDSALANYKRFAVLHMSLFPYRYAAAQEAARDGMPLMRALVLNYQNDQRAREAKDEYMFGPDFLISPVTDAGVARPVYLPAGDWVNYWTGLQATGEKTLNVDAPVDTIPVYVRAGAVIAKIPEDVMTLVPASESNTTDVKSMDDRRVYEVINPFIASEPATQTDFEGRVLVRDTNSLKITDSATTLVTPARVTVRWRFGRVSSATVDGASVEVKSGVDGPYVEFSHAGESLVEWK